MQKGMEESFFPFCNPIGVEGVPFIGYQLSQCSQPEQFVDSAASSATPTES
jgi:hypothetical protein